MDVFSLKDKRVLISGGGSGIGLAISESIIEAGGQIIMIGRNEANLKTATERLGSNAHYVVQDITALAAIPQMVIDIEGRFGPIDVLVNNAGINMKKPSLEVSDEDFARVLNTNITAAFSLTREVAKGMISRKAGSILMISSMAAYYGLDRVPAYTAAKAAIEGLVKTLAVEWGPHQIRVNAIAPGFIDTAMMQTAMQSDPARMNKALGRTSLGYFGKPEHIGHAAVFLSSEAAAYITGVSLRVDGGNAIGF